MQIELNKATRQAGFTIAELVVCFAIVAMTIGGILTAYSNSAYFAERAGYALAAQAQSVQVLERVRAALWDSSATPVVDYTTTFPSSTVAIMDLPISGTNVVYCTNYLNVTTITNSTAPLSLCKEIQVETTWAWRGKRMSNNMVAYRAPDQ
jgi:Tfp pilus assembly protein PilE